MNKYIGIDLGTSSIKAILCDSLGNVLCEASREYELISPKELYFEQNPKIWFSCMIETLKEITKNEKIIKAISFSGQMHGLVILDKNDEPIRNCILWNDSRSTKETKYLNEEIGKDRLISYTRNIAYPGFTAPKLLWVKNNEPDNFKKISKIMLPKDYLAYKLSGVFATDYSDASGTLFLDVKNKCYSKEMLDICSINISMFPKLYESYEVIGRIKKEITDFLGINDDVDIVIGGADNAVAAIGMGINSDCANISLGTSGTILIPMNKPFLNEEGKLHSFCSANNDFYAMGCILTAASARSWWLNNILKSNDFLLDEKEARLNMHNEVFFLPYLNGERSPYNDANIRGSFIGLSTNTKRSDMSLAVMEGVGFALYDCYKCINDIDIKYLTICGGGSKSRLFVELISNIFNLPVKIGKNQYGPALGAAILAMVGSKEYKDIASATKSIIKYDDIIYPNNDTKYYQEKYDKFHRLYPLLNKFYSKCLFL